MKPDPKSIIIIIPAYNAEGSVREVAERVHLSVPGAGVVVIDDGSTDKTAETASRADASVLKHHINLGKGAALQTGFDHVKNIPGIEYIITIDADLQHKPEDIAKFFEASEKEYADIYVGWRRRTGTGMPVHRILSNYLTSFLVGIRTGARIKDSQCGFRMIRNAVLKDIRMESCGYEAETEFLIKAAKHGCRIGFVPVQTVYGDEKSHMTHFKTTVKFLKVLLKGYE
jgi:glycosyltransferase involved in cell wall biosynthesis